MPQGDPQPGEKYLHFKNRMYEVVAVARHSETMERYVVYRRLYGDFETFVRPYDMFISEVDREKYPDAAQRFRFLCLGREEDAGKDNGDDSWLDRILDAKSPEERYDIVCSIRSEATDSLIDDIATVLDLSIPEGDVQERYRQLKECMQTIRRYESDRLRR